MQKKGTKRKVKKNVQTGVAHPVHVQQHHDHDHRRRRQRARVVDSGRARLQARGTTPFAAQVAAEDCAKKAMEHGVRSIGVYVKGPGDESAPALQAAGCDHDDSRRDAHPAQRLPPAEASPGLERSRRMARYIGPVAVCAAVREPLFEGRPLLQREGPLIVVSIRPDSMGRVGRSSEYGVQLRENRRSSASTVCSNAVCEDHGAGEPDARPRG